MSSLVRAACLTNFSEVALASGLEPWRMLQEAGLPATVEREPDLMIPVERVGELLHAAALKSGNESFGLCMAQSRMLSNLGAVGMLIRDQKTLGDSLDVLISYQVLLNSSLSLMIESHADVVVLHEEVKPGKPHQPTRQRIELAMGVMLRLMRQFLGSEWKPLRVCFGHSAPRDVSVHHKMFGFGVQFDAEFNCIVCAKSDLEARNPFADPAMVRYAQQLLDASAQPKQATMSEDVRRTVLLLLPSGRCSIEQVADHLGVACRTVQRGLAEQGLSFSAVVTEIRKELAKRYIIDSDRPLTEVTMLLGFSEPSALSRWYHTQFGCSAMQSRAARADTAGRSPK